MEITMFGNSTSLLWLFYCNIYRIKILQFNKNDISALLNFGGDDKTWLQIQKKIDVNVY